MKFVNLSQLDEESEEINELEKCFYEPASVIVTPGKRKRIKLICVDFFHAFSVGFLNCHILNI